MRASSKTTTRYTLKLSHDEMLSLSLALQVAMQYAVAAGLVERTVSQVNEMYQFVSEVTRP